jgi:hypothetical protein
MPLVEQLIIGLAVVAWLVILVGSWLMSWKTWNAGHRGLSLVCSLFVLFSPAVGWFVFVIGSIIAGPFSKQDVAGAGASPIPATSSTSTSSVSGYINHAASSGPDVLLIWTAVGAIGALLGGIAAIVAVVQRR